ncbi:hypothetical protein FACS1894123_11890 [Bacteroidia bacterium]|nr:hypothetical protein FACS1894123_11890 [Bacteroidia bacterium]
MYSVNANEKYFYETKYVNLRGKCTNLDTLGINFPDTINIENIGKAKKDLLDFVYNVTKDETALRFEGNRGYGKTTILRYLFFYVVPILNSKNEKKITPLYVSFNEQLGYFNQENEKGEIKKKFYNVLSDKIKNYYADVLSDVNNKFWGEYLSGKDGFGDYTTKLKRIENKKCSSTEKITEKEKLIDEFLKSPQAILHCFAYAAKERDKSVPVIILDDLDPLNTSVVQSIFEEIYSILHSFKIKVIYTIRPATAKKIKRIADFTKNPFINLNKPELLDVYLEKYIKIFINNIDNGSNTTIELKDKKIEISESKKFYYNFLDILKQSRSRDLLENIADGNIRLYKELVKTCLCSGFIKSEGLIAKLIDNSFDIYQSVPYWIIYNSVITQNHKLLFPEVKVSNSEHIINLLCNGGEMFHKYLVRLYLLSYFTKRGDVSFAKKS